MRWVNKDIVEEALRNSLPPHLFLDRWSFFYPEEESSLGNLDLSLPMTSIKQGQNSLSPMPQFLHL